MLCMNNLEKVHGLSIYTQYNCSWICDLLVPRLMVVWLRLTLSHKSKIPGPCTQTQMENYCYGWMARRNSTRLVQVKKLMVLQPMNAMCVTSFGFQGDATTYGGTWPTKCGWLVWTLQSAHEFPCMLRIIRNSHGVNPGKDPSTIDECFMWFETKHSQPTHYCKLVQETKPYGSWVSTNKYRWKSANWKYSKPLEPSSNVAVQCPGCKEVFWKRHLYKHISQNHAHFLMTPAIFSSISMYPHKRDYVKSLVENPGKALTSKGPKNDKDPRTLI